jgi:glycosyltransferase involved in cell wall biosynthesis
LTPPDTDTISVVISTYQRPDACERALRSVLEQTEPPLEVLICDDGSRDDTPARFRAWEEHCENVRYLRIPDNTGTPASARNLGIADARGHWIAFLDDDDEWLPGKLEAQRAAIARESADVISTNARRSDGSVFFVDAPSTLRPTRSDVLKTNPVITSSAMVRRSLAGFPTALWMRGIEDYAAWLDLADGGARFVVLGEPLVRYQDASADRLSAARAHRQIAIARLTWRRMMQQPYEPARIRAALRWTAGATYVTVADGLASIRARRNRDKPSAY